MHNTVERALHGVAKTTVKSDSLNSKNSSNKVKNSGNKVYEQ